MDGRIHVIHVFYKMDREGAQTFIINVYRNFDQSKFQFDFIVQTLEKGQYDEEIREFGSKIHYIPKLTLFNVVEYIKLWNNFFKKNNEYRIIHSHAQGSASIYMSIAKKHGLKTISHSHTYSSENSIVSVLKNIFQIPIRRIADVKLACSEKAGQWLYGKKTDFEIINNAI
ncbi:MAG: glycosyltransferase, partial [Clostridiales bacterium]